MKLFHQNHWFNKCSYTKKAGDTGSFNLIRVTTLSIFVLKFWYVCRRVLQFFAVVEHKKVMDIAALCCTEILCEILVQRETILLSEKSIKT